MAAGMVAWFAGNVPAGWLVCDGTEYSQMAYPSLYAAIGGTFGTADPGKFRVPNLIGKFARGAETPGATGGADEVTLTVEQLPEHSHAVRCSADDGDVDEAVANYPAKSSEDIYAASQDAAMAAGMVETTGSGEPVPTVPSYLALTPAIYAA